MRFRLTLIGEYEILDSEVALTYGTTKPEECAAMDQTTFEDDVFVIVECLSDGDYSVTVEVLP